VLTVGAVFLADASPAWATGDVKVAASPRLGISVSVHKSAETPDAYECTVVVTDLASGAEIAAPTIIAKYGQTAEVVNSRPGGEILRAKVTVDSEGTVAEYSVSLVRATETLTQHNGKISLSR
jgi:hypothetical protein